MRINSQKGKEKKKKKKLTNSNEYPIHTCNLLHTVAGYSVLVLVCLFFFVCSFRYGITSCHILRIVTGNVHIKTASITTAICLTEMEFNSIITFDVFLYIFSVEVITYKHGM